jgi:monoterpene epsilon-lactone hydrolase
MNSSYRSVRFIARIVVVVIGAVTVSQVLAEEKSLRQRTLPAAAGASDALRASIAKAPQPDVAASQGITLQTDEEWVKFVAAADKPAKAAVEALAGRLKVTIKEENTAGVTVFRMTPPNINPANKTRLFVHTHGGA